MASEKQVAEKLNKNAIVKQATDLPHIFLIDWDDTGVLREVAVVAEFPDGTICGILVDTLHTIDKARLKKVITSVHATKYQLWELLSEARLSNGLNALDYFHSNFVKQKRPKGARLSQDSLAGLNVKVTDRMIGADFVNPAEATLDQGSKMFNV